jgi:hypothetical protein
MWSFLFATAHLHTRTFCPLYKTSRCAVKEQYFRKNNGRSVKLATDLHAVPVLKLVDICSLFICLYVVVFTRKVILISGSFFVIDIVNDRA